MKYKLIKEYPGSPPLGTIVESSSFFGRTSYKYLPNDITGLVTVLSSHVEDNPEYWEKVNENLWWVVFRKDQLQDGKECFLAWKSYQIECIYTPWEDGRWFFKTKESADEFIIDNKPCLSYTDIMWNFPHNTKKDNVSIDIGELIKLIKSKI